MKKITILFKNGTKAEGKNTNFEIEIKGNWIVLSADKVTRYLNSDDIKEIIIVDVDVDIDKRL